MKRQGLTTEEATQLLQRYGENKLVEAKKESLLKKIGKQLLDVLMLILLIGAIVSYMIGETTDAFIILIVVVLNITISLVQEYKADDALEALKNMTVPKAFVRRDGIVQEVEATAVVVGDVVLLEAGRLVPADLEIIQAKDLMIDESALTGESVPQLKEVNEIAAMSTIVTNGTALGIVKATGMDTEIGKIASMLNATADDLTPLQKSLNTLGKYLGIATVLISIIIFSIGFFQGRDIREMFMLAISLAVAAIPEGLPAVVTIVLALGMRKMVKRHVIIRKLPAVEALGSVDVICSDKTGTLTQNKMTVLHVMAEGHIEKPNAHHSALDILAEVFAHCHHVERSAGDWIGEPTEVGLVTYAYKYDSSLYNRYPLVDEIPFDSTRKMMTTIHEKDGRTIAYTKGALDRVLEKCAFLWEKGEAVPLTFEKRHLIQNQANEMASDALRVLGAAMKREGDLYREDELIFVGFAAMMDPPREEVKAALAETKKAGIRTVMITGDDPHTAFAIGRQLGLAHSMDEVWTGTEIDAVDSDTFARQVRNVCIFARVSPTHKVKIVQALQAHNLVVSMTGDGVNDAPSLKAADVGVAMGITGTDVAKGASDIVLTDDNFSSIVQAVKEGRTIFNNIKKTVLFLLSCNLGEIIALFFGILLGWPTLLRPVHILWVNLITDTFPALALGVDNDNRHVMEQKPRRSEEHILHGSLQHLVWNGLLIGVLTLFAFILGAYYVDGQWMHGQNLSAHGLMVAQTMAFLTLSFAQLFHAFNVRSMTDTIFSKQLWSNRYLLYAFGFGLMLQVILVTVGPLANVFHLHALTMAEWLTVFGLSIIPIFFNEMLKLKRRRAKNRVQ
ncbi:cation-translocating P-type ATPase [Savagea serpentis]|nr:cation-translocating P-type ATPase [Savagea serpentis]